MRDALMWGRKEWTEAGGGGGGGVVLGGDQRETT